MTQPSDIWPELDAELDATYADIASGLVGLSPHEVGEGDLKAVSNGSLTFLVLAMPNDAAHDLVGAWARYVSHECSDAAEELNMFCRLVAQELADALGLPDPEGDEDDDEPDE